MGNVTLTATGSPGYFQGITGFSALNLVNPAAGTSAQYVRGSIANYTNFSVTGWFNCQSLAASESNIFGMGFSSGQYFTIKATISAFTVEFRNLSNVLITIGSTTSISTNTWYNFTVIFQSAGTCYAYLNNVLIGSVAGATLTNPTTTFAISAYTNYTLSGAFKWLYR